jgi:predicted permease
MQTRYDTQTYDTILAFMMFSLVGVVLLIACANIANLLLGRGKARSRELAVRVAIGASRARLVTTLLAECILLAGGGCVLGLFIAQAGVNLVSSVKIPSDIPIDLTIQLDGRVLFFSIALSLASALLFGLGPALRMTSGDLVPALKAGDLNPARQRFFGRNTLVVAQVAGSLVLMVLTTQLFRGVTYVLGGNPGFRTEHRLLVSFNPAVIGYTPEQTAAFYRDLLTRVDALAGVKSAALAHFIPTGTNFEQETVSPEGYQFPRGQKGAMVGASTVDENYFATIGTPIVEGRGFRASDDAKAPAAIVVNQFFVKHYGLRNPVGKRVLLGDKDPRWAQIVGVAANSKYFSPFEPGMDFFYRPMKQHPDSNMTLIAECQGDALRLAEVVRQTVRSLAPNLPLLSVRTFDDLYHQRSVKVASVFLVIVGSLSLIGLGLALVGLYAVMAYQVSLRTREIGIRMAIGASKRQVTRMVLGQAAVLGVSGTVIGLLLSFLAGQQLTAGLQLPRFDATLFAGVVLSLLIVMLAAALIPARRASLIDPMVAMRQD